MGNRTFGGSNIGGIAETQDMLDFCGKHNITADVEVIPASRINEAYEEARSWPHSRDGTAGSGGTAARKR